MGHYQTGIWASVALLLVATVVATIVIMRSL